MSPDAAGWVVPRQGVDWAARRFWPKVRFGPDCWEWMASTNGHGYGHVFRDGRYPHAHRVAYELVRGPIPDGLVIDHLCRNRLCVNPGHMEVVTTRENLLRGETMTAHRAATTHCPQRHPYDAENTHVSRRGQRHCRTCRRERMRAVRAGLAWP